MQSIDNKDNEKNGKINTKRIYTMKYSRNCCCICCFCHEVVKSKFNSVIFEISNIRICHINIKNSVKLIACVLKKKFINCFIRITFEILSFIVQKSTKLYKLVNDFKLQL